MLEFTNLQQFLSVHLFLPTTSLDKSMSFNGCLVYVIYFSCIQYSVDTSFQVPFAGTQGKNVLQLFVRLSRLSVESS